MDLSRAIKIIDLEETPSSNNESIEAVEIFFKEMFDVNIKNKDDSYKSMYDCFQEANEKLRKSSFI